MSGLRKILSRKPVNYHPELARAFGSIMAALFFEEICHWQGNDPERWVFRTQGQLDEALVMSSDVQARARGRLKKLRVLEEERRGVPARLYYRPDWDRLEELLSADDADDEQADKTANPDGARGDDGASGTGHQKATNTESRAKVQTPTNPETSVGVSEDQEEAKPQNPTRAHDDGGVVTGHNDSLRSNERARRTPAQRAIDQFYERLKTEYSVKLTTEQFTHHVNLFDTMLRRDEPTEEEVQSVVDYLVERFPNYRRYDAVQALQDVRLDKAKARRQGSQHNTAKTNGSSRNADSDEPREAAAARRKEGYEHLFN